MKTKKKNNKIQKIIKRTKIVQKNKNKLCLNKQKRLRRRIKNSNNNNKTIKKLHKICIKSDCFPFVSLCICLFAF